MKLSLPQAAVIVTGTDWPGDSCPLDGLNSALPELLVADHDRSPCESDVSVSVTVHCQASATGVQLLVSKLPALAANVCFDGSQLQVAVIVFSGPMKVKLEL
jgi:hypothetical protein